MKKSFQRVIATLNLFQGKQSLTIFLLAAIFALSACDDSSSAGDDDNNVILSGDSREESSDSRSSDRRLQRQQGQSFFGRNINQVQQLEFIWNDYEVKQQFCG